MAPFGGEQWGHLGLYSLAAGPETRILVKDFLRECSQKKGNKEAGWGKGEDFSKGGSQLEVEPQPDPSSS